MSSSFFDDKLKAHRLYFEARQQKNGYFEKLALLDGATVSLVVTAALGKFLGVLRHKYTLGVALTCLVAAMLVLLYRNNLAIRAEFHEAVRTAHGDTEQHQRKMLQIIDKRIGLAQTVGVALSAAGIVLLLTEVWLVLLAA